MRRLPLIILLCPTLLLGASGDIVSPSVFTNGWELLVGVTGANTNGSQMTGLAVPPGGNWNAPQPSQPINPSVVGTVTSQGYNDLGVLTTNTRTIYGTILVRNAYPSNSHWAQVIAGGVLTNWLALSDYVCNTDSNLTFTFAKGWYSDGTVSNNAATSTAVSNGSQLTNARVIANWSWPGNQLITNTSETLRCVAYHYSGQFGRPCRVVKFWASDMHGNWTATNFVTTTMIDLSIPDKVPVEEYVTTLSLAGLTSGDRVTNYFAAYPWIGNAGSVTDCSDGVNAAGSPNYCPLVNYYQTNGSVGKLVAIVDPVNGVNATAVVVTNFTQGASILPYLTISAAAKALSQTNLAWFGHSGCEGCTVLLTNGTYAWAGASGTYGTNGFAWLNISAYPGVAASNVTISSITGDTMINTYEHIKGVTVATTSGNLFYGSGNVWLDQCTFANTGGDVFYASAGTCSLTDSTIPLFAMGFCGGSGVNDPLVLMRGNDITGYANSSAAAVVYTVLGNYAGPQSNNASLWQDWKSGPTAVAPACPIFANNVFYRFSTSLEPLWYWVTSTNSFGAAIVQNLVEGCYNSGTQPISGLAGDGSAAMQINNVLCWNNVFLGQRSNWAYDEYGATNAHWRIGWSVSGNIWAAYNIKTDNFAGGPASGVRIGNFSEVYGVGYWNNFHINVNGGGAFVGEFCGLNAYGPWTNAIQSYAQPPQGATNTVNYASFRTNGSWNGLATGPSYGDYRMLSSSPAMLCPSSQVWLPPQWKLGFDLNGAKRSLIDPPGAYIDGQARRGF